MITSRERTRSCGPLCRKQLSTKITRNSTQKWCPQFNWCSSKFKSSVRTTPSIKKSFRRSTTRSVCARWSMKSSSTNKNSGSTASQLLSRNTETRQRRRLKSSHSSWSRWLRDRRRRTLSWTVKSTTISRSKWISSKLSSRRIIRSRVSRPLPSTSLLN